MTTLPPIAGLWIPLITPFRDGALDERSVRRLARHYGAQPVDGLILAATTGEALTLTEEETGRLVALVAAEVSGKLPIILGRCGSDTRRMAAALELTAGWPVAGYLITCPYYSRPSQDGLFGHFATLAQSTDRPVLVYNIPYRTGVNLANDTLLRLAEIANVVGVKDCCADQAQSFDLIRDRPEGFAVLTGEDALFYGALTQGADGGILASAHVDMHAFAAVSRHWNEGDRNGALAAWRKLVHLPRLLFSEPSPAPIKHWLWRAGLITSPELRLPMTPVSEALAQRIEGEIARYRTSAG